MGKLIRWFFFASLSFVLLMQLRAIDAALVTVSTPLGIVGYELAFTVERASMMLSVWRDSGVLDMARASLGVDVAFLLAYPWLLRSSIRLFLPDADAVNGDTVGEQGKPVTGSTVSPGLLDRAGAILSQAVLACIPLDLLENLLLWRMIESQPAAAMTILAGVAAAVKFCLVASTALWCVAAIVARLFLRHHGQRRNPVSRI